MELKEAKQIVESLKNKSFEEAMKIENVNEAIRMVCEAAPRDEEAARLQAYIPTEMSYIGLYPHVMKSFDMPKATRDVSKVLKELEKNVNDYKFAVGDEVWKPKGYKFDSTIVAVFKTTKGQKRVVAENADGLLHIFNEDNLELRNR
jgi:hypothetical protein